MGGKRSRRKGHAFERFVAIVLRVCFPDARRGLQYRDPEACDIEGTPFRIECKNHATLSYNDIHAALEQATENGKAHNDKRPPIAVTKTNRKKPLVHMTLETLVTLVERFFYSPPDPAEIIPIVREK